jgi:hypothetical protein
MTKQPSGRKRFFDIPPVEPTGRLHDDAELNEAIAIYNWTGNALAAWSILGLCLKHGHPVPQPVSAFFSSIADKLIDYSTNDRPRARDDVADLVLGTKNSGGGPSIFQKYRSEMEERKLVKLIEHELTTQASPDISDILGSRSKTEVYEMIAERFGKSVDTIKKLHETDEREHGSLSISRTRSLLKKGGIQEI